MLNLLKNIATKNAADKDGKASAASGQQTEADKKDDKGGHGGCCGGHCH